MDSPYAANWQGKLREQIDKYPQAAIGVAILILAAIVLLFSRREPERERKPGRVIKIRERIIERPGATTIIERERAPDSSKKDDAKKDAKKDEAKDAAKDDAKKDNPPAKEGE